MRAMKRISSDLPARIIRNYKRNTGVSPECDALITDAGSAETVRADMYKLSSQVQSVVFGHSRMTIDNFIYADGKHEVAEDLMTCSS
eukprot:IDg18855t1